MIYLNNAATGFPKPPAVVDRVLRSLEEVPGDGRRGETGGEDVLAGCRARLASLFGVGDPRRVILTPGATCSLNYALHAAVETLSAAALPSIGRSSAPLSAPLSAPWSAPAPLTAPSPSSAPAPSSAPSFAGPVPCLTSVLEHNSVLRPLVHCATEGRIRLDFLSPEELLSPDRIRGRLRHARLLVLTAASNVTGQAPDLAALGRIGEEMLGRNFILVVDAAQAAGSIPLDLRLLPERTLVALAGHKGLCGPSGTGALLIGGGFSDGELPALVRGGTGVKSELLEQPSELPLRFESGTMNLPGFAGLCAGLDFVAERGIEELGRHKARLISGLVSQLEEIPGLRCLDPPDGDRRAGVLSFWIDPWDPHELALILRESFSIHTRAGLHCAPLVHRGRGCAHGTVRASVGWNNTEKDVAALASALRRITGSGLCTAEDPESEARAA